METPTNRKPVLPEVIAVTVERHLELLRDDTNRTRRQHRKSLGFGALYGSDPDPIVFLPRDYVEEHDVVNHEAVLAAKRAERPAHPLLRDLARLLARQAVRETLVKRDFAEIERRFQSQNGTVDRG